MCLKCQTLNLSIDIDGLEPEFKRVAKLIYAGKMKQGDIDEAMVKKMAKQLLASFWEGYNNGPAMQPSFVNHIKQNVYVFSGFKNYNQLKEASMLLLNDDGSYKNFNTWFNEIKQINGTYNEIYARAEHANALATGQSLASWNDFNEHGITRLRFETAGDSRVRDEHAILNGTVVDIGDPMLDKYYTPLDWGCRCEWVPAIDEDLTGWRDLPTVPPMFQTNVAKTGVIFPDTHPYYFAPKPIADNIIKQANDWMLEDNPTFTPKGIEAYESKLGVKIDRDIFKHLDRETKFVSKGNKGAYYIPQDNTVNIPIDDRRKRTKTAAERTVYHEFAHALDWQHGLKDLDAVKDLMSTYRKKYKNQLVDLGKQVYNIGYNAHVMKDFDTVENVGALADTIMSLDKKAGFGHGYKVIHNGKKIDYFDVPGYKEAEFIAHAFENKYGGNEIFKRFMPDLYEDMIKMVDGFFKP